MARITFGEKSWEEDGAGGGGGTRNDFLSMKDPRSYVMRILKNPHEFAMHWVDTDEGTKRVNCAARDCFLCKAGVKASIRYLVPVYYRADKACKIAEFGPLVHGQIRKIYKTPGWGSPFDYDICIDKKSAKSPSEMYFTTPMSKAPLTAAEKAAVAEFLDRIDMDSFSASISNDEIAKKIGIKEAAKLGYKPSSASALDAGEDPEDPGVQVQSYNFEDLENQF